MQLYHEIRRGNTQVYKENNSIELHSNFSQSPNSLCKIFLLKANSTGLLRSGVSSLLSAAPMRRGRLVLIG